ncbi:protein CHLOROPLAST VESICULATION [Humulus lupulus]|uniref:protein CHLOROPLAST VESICULATION n=1 Tax=Humulus lupulus TaxID=3486 RepID=UPI002B405AA1|nr:protein CHLOROPLAST VESICULATION [Humulus lupulus]
MALIRISCCLNLPPKPSKTSQLYSCVVTTKEESRTLPIINNQRMGGFVGMIIGLEMVSLVMMGTQSNGYYHAKPNDRAALISTGYTRESNYVSAKWSERIRLCPPWHLNSLESVVPENLPRPYARRRSEFVAHAPPAPALEFDYNHVYVRGDCFSM